MPKATEVRVPFDANNVEDEYYVTTRTLEDVLKEIKEIGYSDRLWDEQVSVAPIDLVGKTWILVGGRIFLKEVEDTSLPEYTTCDLCRFTYKLSDELMELLAGSCPLCIARQIERVGLYRQVSEIVDIIGELNSDNTYCDETELEIKAHLDLVQSEIDKFIGYSDLTISDLIVVCPELKDKGYNG